LDFMAAVDKGRREGERLRAQRVGCGHLKLGVVDGESVLLGVVVEAVCAFGNTIDLCKASFGTFCFSVEASL
jgi:hypothetical protein